MLYVYFLQNHDNEYNNWESQQSLEGVRLAETNHGKRSPQRSTQETGDQRFSDIHTYPLPLDYYDLYEEQR